MHSLDKVRLCLGMNVVLLATLVFTVTTLASDHAYFRAGPHPDFTLVGVVVDTPARYAGLLALIGVTNCIKVVVAEMGEPVLVFNVYNPDKTLITDFTRTQLLWYANLMFFVSNTRRVFEVLVTVTQFDIAVFSVVVEQIVSIGTVYLLVREKRFGEDAMLA